MEDEFKMWFKHQTCAIIESDLVYLYAGSSVLSAYYKDETWSPNDIDIFVGVREFKDIELKIKIKDEFDFIFGPEYGNPLWKYIRVFDSNKRKVLDIIVFLMEGIISKTTLHELMVREFDIKICSLAWDGHHLFFPPQELVNLETRESRMVFKTPVGRQQKYIKRGFVLRFMGEV